jgi:hypothetical protein
MPAQNSSWIGDGTAVPIDARFPVRDIQQALNHLSKGELRGRMAVQVDGSF